MHVSLGVHHVILVVVQAAQQVVKLRDECIAGIHRHYEDFALSVLPQIPLFSTLWAAFLSQYVAVWHPF